MDILKIIYSFVSFRKLFNMAKDYILPDTVVRKILNTAYFKINEVYFANEEDISEYEIQFLFFDTLKKQIKNKGCIVKKEKERVDITITDTYETLKYCFEVKSYIKSHEKISITAINKDINDLGKFLSENNTLKKRAFVLLAIREKTLQTSKYQNSELANFLNHKSKVTPLIINEGFKHYLTSSFTIVNNNSTEKKNNGHQVRLFLIEIKKYEVTNKLK